MPPLRELPSTFTTNALPVYGHGIPTRDIDPSRVLNETQLLALMCVSLSLSSVSVLAALHAFYWFVCMRRNFRHDLIMLLIQSDMLKALWLAISPLVYFSFGSRALESQSNFCQVSGFFLTLSVEASDVAVLLIAIHTVLFILQPRRSQGTTGLHPYRRYAYSLWIILPIVLASIVPITGGRFVNNGPYCYLPLRPGWYRDDLSWVPRYVIVGAIILTYTCVYIYVHLRFRRFGENQRRPSGPEIIRPLQQDEKKTQCPLVPPTPPIACHGLLDHAQKTPAQDERGGKDRQRSVASTVSSLQLGESVVRSDPTNLLQEGSIPWKLVIFSQVEHVGNGQQETREGDNIPISPRTQKSKCDAGSSVRRPEPVYDCPSKLSSRGQSTQNESRIQIQKFSRQRAQGNSFTSSLHSRILALWHNTSSTRRTNSGHTTITNDGSFQLLEPEEAAEVMRRSRDKMQRQLRLLFVYPAIYILTWIAPFVSHVLVFDDDVEVFPGDPSNRSMKPFSLAIVSLVSLCIGAAIDCCFFSAWEQPWHHRKGTFLEGLGTRFRIKSIAERRKRGRGRTREEIFLDSRAARKRRQKEVLDNLQKATVIRMEGLRQKGPPREWWDAIDTDESPPRDPFTS